MASSEERISDVTLQIAEDGVVGARGRRERARKKRAEYLNSHTVDLYSYAVDNRDERTSMTNPYERAFPAPALTVALGGLDGQAFPAAVWSSATAHGTSPAISWSDAPEGTESFLVTIFDPDAPVPGGFWHWLAVVPGDVTQLSPGASGDGMPAGSRELPNSFGTEGFTGPNPPAGTGTHRYFIVVTALMVPANEISADPSIAMLHASIVPATLARGVAIATAEAPPARNGQSGGSWLPAPHHS